MADSTAPPDVRDEDKSKVVDPEAGSPDSGSVLSGKDLLEHAEDPALEAKMRLVNDVRHPSRAPAVARTPARWAGLYCLLWP